MFMQASIRSLNFHFAIAVLTKGMQGKYAHMDTYTVGSDKSQKFLTSNVQTQSDGQYCNLEMFPIYISVSMLNTLISRFHNFP